MTETLKNDFYYTEFKYALWANRNYTHFFSNKKKAI